MLAATLRRRRRCFGAPCLSGRPDSASRLVGARQIPAGLDPAAQRRRGAVCNGNQAETLSDDKGALRADWTHGKGTLSAYYFLDGYSLLNPYPTGTGGASVPGFSATCNGLAQLSASHTPSPSAMRR